MNCRNRRGGTSRGSNGGVHQRLFRSIAPRPCAYPTPAKAAGDVLIVAINSDRSVKSIKAPQRPILPETDRVELIAAMEMVDYVILFDEPDPYKLIASIKPQVLAKGGDWSSEKIIGADIVEAAGGRVAVIPYLEGFSTTEIIERIKKLRWLECVKFAAKAVRSE